MGLHLSIEHIGLGQLADGLGEVAHLARVHGNHRESDASESCQYRYLEASGRFQHDQDGLECPQACGRGADASGVIAYLPAFARRPRSDLQGCWRQHWLTRHTHDSAPMDWQRWLTDGVSRPVRNGR
jgi:hypothetical protein